jgi:tetratricopeptide (TPR) repeat protein
MARPELLDRRPAWAGGKLNATTVSLEPLSEDETDELIAGLLVGSALEEGLQTRIRRAAGGNPLYLEEMLAFVGRSSNGDEIEIPPTIQALLAARLDQLDPSERHVLERGSVEGEVFHRGGVAALIQDETPVDGWLVALVRKDLVRPEHAQLAGEDGYRFRHLLIRDAAYEALPKATRAELHERFAAWLETRGAELVELDEIVGYHLERAFRYRGELGPLTASDRIAGAHAGELLARAGRKALERGDRRAAANLFERASELFPEDAPERVRALTDIGRVLLEAGHDYQGSRSALERALAGAEALGREDLLVRARIELSFHAMLVTDINPEELEALSRRAIEVLEREGDEEGLSRAWFAVGLIGWAGAMWDSMREPLLRSIEHAQRAGNKSIERDVLGMVLGTILFGSTSAAEGIAETREIREQHPDSLEIQAWTNRVMGSLIALQGDEDTGRKLLEEARATFAELGHDEALAVHPFSMAPLELRAGNPGAAERELRAGLEILEGTGERARAGHLAAMLAGVLAQQGRLDEADEHLAMARETIQEIDVSGRSQLKISTARVLARRGELEEALSLAAEAVGLIEGTQELLNMPELFMWQAEVLELAGRVEDAKAALTKAVDAAARKGSVVGVALATERLAALEGSER